MTRRIRILEKSSLRSTDDIMCQLEDTLDAVLKSGCPVDIADVRIRCCKHAIQIIALSYMASGKTINKNEKLKHLSIK